MENHPLSFFKRLVEAPEAIKELRTKFYASDKENRISDDEESEGIEEWFYNYDDEREIGFRFFADSFNYLCKEEIASFYDRIDSYVLNEVNDNIMKDYLNRVHFELNYLIQIFPTKNHINHYPAIQKILQNMKDYLETKYGIGGVRSKNKIPESAQENPMVR